MGASEYQLEIDHWNDVGSCDARTRSACFTTAVPAWTPQGASPAGCAADRQRRRRERRLEPPRSTARLLRPGARARHRSEREHGRPATGRCTTTSSGPLFTYSTTSRPPATRLCPATAALVLCAQYYVDAGQHDRVADAAGVRLEAGHGRGGLLRHRLEGSELLEHPRLRVHERDGLRAATRQQPVGTPTRRRARSSTGSCMPTGEQRRQRATRRPATSRASATSRRSTSSRRRRRSSRRTSAAPACRSSGLRRSVRRTTRCRSRPTRASRTCSRTSTPTAPPTRRRRRIPRARRCTTGSARMTSSGNGLTWATGVFTRSLAAPVPSAPTGDDQSRRSSTAFRSGRGRPSRGPSPTTSTSTIRTARRKDVNGIQATSTSWSKLDGPGVWHWKVRAEFAKARRHATGTVLARRRPSRGRSASRSAAASWQRRRRLIFSWEPKQGAKTYHLQVSANPDFSSTIDDVTQDAARFAPTLTSDGYINGGRLFWHVAAVDAEGNQGDWSTTAEGRRSPRA